MHGLMPQNPVVRHSRAVGAVPSTATAAALFNIEVGQETRQEKEEKKLFRSRQCIITARHLAQLAFGPKADAPTFFQSSHAGAYRHITPPTSWYSQAQI